ncbi:signal peptidase I [Candidatus Microgenomates bacterium]|nr:MAG: signal peptidase I [Candidatus Microgenomates bacterium]
MKAKKLLIVSMSALSGVSFGVAVSTYLFTSGLLHGQYRAFIVQSGSMEPTIKTGSIAITKTQDNYGVGDIITFSLKANKKEYITHRVVDTAEGLKTKGDANEEPDLWTVASEEIVGKTIFTIPYVGYFADFVRTPRGFVVFVVVPATIIVYEEFKTITKEIKKMFQKLRQNEI